MVSGDDSAKKGTELSLIKESRIDKKLKKNNWDFDMIILFLPNMLLLAGLRAKFTVGGNPTMG